jgi:hypothetical protein
MAEYDIAGWTVPDLITPTDVNFFGYAFRENNDESSRGFMGGNGNQ